MNPAPRNLSRPARVRRLEIACAEYAINLRAVTEALGAGKMWTRERHRYESAMELDLPDLVGSYKPEAP